MEPYRSQYARRMARSGSPGRVETWLAQLALQESSTELLNNECSQIESHSKERKPPATPIRSRETSTSFDETSPTNTSFSCHSIFDNPHINSTLHNRDDRSDTSATTVDDDDDKWHSQCSEEVHEEEEEDLITPSEALSSHSANSPTETSVDIDTAATPHLDLPAFAPIDPSKPRLVWITSCVQCTLAGLPCSRSPPACSRCKRKGEGGMCLLRRRKLGEERVRGDGVGNKVNVLLKMREEGEVVWGRKVELAKELEEVWNEKEERRNWVLPMCGVSGKYWISRGRELVGERDMGEGIGRQTWAEVVLG